MYVSGRDMASNDAEIKQQKKLWRVLINNCASRISIVGRADGIYRNVSHFGKYAPNGFFFELDRNHTTQRSGNWIGTGERRAMDL